MWICLALINNTKIVRMANFMLCILSHTHQKKVSFVRKIFKRIFTIICLTTANFCLFTVKCLRLFLPFLRPRDYFSILGVHWRDWWWSWNSNTLATWWEELTHLKRPWCRERLRAGGEEDDRGWDDWMASLTWWFEQALGVGKGQGSLVCCSPWGRKKSDTTEQLNWTE